MSNLDELIMAYDHPAEDAGSPTERHARKLAAALKVAIEVLRENALRDDFAGATAQTALAEIDAIAEGA